MNKEFFILIIILYLYLLIYLNKKIKEADNIVNIYFEKLEIILRDFEKKDHISTKKYLVPTNDERKIYQEVLDTINNLEKLIKYKVECTFILMIIILLITIYNLKVYEISYLVHIQAYAVLFSFVYFLILFSNSKLKIMELEELKSILGILLNLK